MYNVNTSNSFDPIAGIPGDDSVFMSSVSDPCLPDGFAPTAFSSPAADGTYANSHHSGAGSLGAHGSSVADSTTSNRASSSNKNEQPDLNNLRIVVANVNSIRGKKVEMAHLCSSVKPDIILISESKLDKDIKCSEFLPANYAGDIRRDHSKHRGGVMILHKKDLVIDDLEILSDDDHHDHIIWARLSVRNASPIYIGSYYRSNSKNTKDTIPALTSTLEKIRSLTRNNPKATIVVGGDFNAKEIDWSNCTVKRDAHHGPICEGIIGALQEHNLEQLQKSPTRQDAPLDLYCTNKPGLVKSINVIPGFTANDHDFIVVDNWIKAERLKKAPRKFYKWSKANWEDIKSKTVAFVSSFLEVEGK